MRSPVSSLSFVVAAAIVLAATGCAMFFPDPEPVRRGSLKDAMDKASDTHAGRRQVSDSYVRDDESDDDDEGRGFFSLLFSRDDDEPVQETGRHTQHTHDTRDEAPLPARPDTPWAVTAVDSDRHFDTIPPSTPLSDPAGLSTPAADSALSTDIGTLVNSLSVPATTLRRQPSVYRALPPVDGATDTARVDSSASDATTETVDSAETTVPPRKRRRPRSTLLLGAEAYAAYVGSSTYTNVNGGQVLLALHPAKRLRHSLGLGLGAVHLQEGEKLEESVSDAFLLDIEYQFRRYVNPDHAFMGLFWMAGLGVRVLSWDYRNPITTDVYDADSVYLRTDEISHDRLTGFAGDVGVGIALMRLKHYRLSVEPRLGGVLYWYETGEGFSNDFFRPEWYFKLSLESVWGVGRD